MSYYQGPPWPPQEPQPQSNTYSQPPYQQPQFYAQPTGGFGPPPQPPKRKKNRLWLILGIVGGVLIASCVLCSVVSALAGGSHPTATATPTATTAPTQIVDQPTQDNAQVLDTPTDVPTTVPTATPTTEPMPTPVPTHASLPTPRPTQPPPPKPTPTPCQSPCNPWGYSFSPGNYIYSPNANFCAYFACINNFWNGVGFVNECHDGMYSKSGGRSGDCSYHGGEWRPLYSH